MLLPAILYTPLKISRVSAAFVNFCSGFKYNVRMFLLKERPAYSLCSRQPSCCRTRSRHSTFHLIIARPKLPRSYVYPVIKSSQISQLEFKAFDSNLAASADYYFEMIASYACGLAQIGIVRFSILRDNSFIITPIFFNNAHTIIIPSYPYNN